MKLKLDENLGLTAAHVLTKAGHDVGTVQGEGLNGAEDNRLVEICRSEGRCLVTLDLEFGNPLVFKPSEHAGIVVLRLPPKPAPQDLADAVETLVRGLARDSVGGKLWVVQRARIREHQPE